MRRVLSHGSFLRFYLLLGLALCVVFFIALGGRSFIEQVRREDYREQLAALPMSLMTQQLASVPIDERETLLGDFSEQLGMQLVLRDMNDLAPSDAWQTGGSSRRREREYASFFSACQSWSVFWLAVC